YRQVRLMDAHAWSRFGDQPEPAPPAKLVFANLSCCFQWYAVTLCNFVELIGAIGWELDRSRKPPRDYVKVVIPAVLDYRNKVGAHIGRAPRNAASPAQQLQRLLPPTAFMNGRYHAGGLATYVRRSCTQSTGTVLQWSLTETHESLAERYW